MKLPEVSIRRPVLATMMNLALVIFGAMALRGLPVRELPDIDPPLVSIETYYPGAAAEVVETEITERIEAQIAGIEGVVKITSNSREESSQITIEFDLDRDIDLAAQDVRDRVARVRDNLPEDAEEPQVTKQDADARPIMWVAMFSETMDPVELTKLAEDVLVERLQTVPGVSNVWIGGAKRYAVRLRLDPAKLAAYHLTVADVEAALRLNNVELPSGRVEGPDRERVIQTRGRFLDAAAFNAMVVATRGDRLVRLEDIGRAIDSVEDERRIARYKGRPTIGLGIVRHSKANTVLVADGVKAEIERIKPSLPAGVQLFYAYDESIYVKRAIEEVWITLGIAFLLVVLTVYLFLGSARATLVPSLTIPVSVMATFLILGAFGYSINIVTMLALVLAIGLVVDDSIVVLENIERHMRGGEPRMLAATNAMREIAFAVIATTVSLVAVFVPLAFQTSTTGRLFVEFAITLAGAVVISSFVALTLTPAVAARVLNPAAASGGRLLPRFEAFLNRTTDAYARTLHLALSHRGQALATLAAAVVLGAFFFTRLDFDFLPDEDKGRLFGVALAPEGATPAYTDRMVRQMEAIAADFPEIAGYFTAVALGSNAQGNRGFMFARLADDRERSAQDLVAGPNGLRARFFREVEGAFSFVTLPSAIGRGFGQPYQLVLQHPDLQLLAETTAKIAAELSNSGMLVGVRSQFRLDKPGLDVEFDRERMAALGVSVREVSRTLQVLFGGLQVSEIQNGGRAYPVIADMARNERATPADIGRIHVRTATGEMVPLSAFVRLVERGGPSAIARYQRQRSATIEATLGDDVAISDAVAATEKVLAQHLPPGFRTAWEGDVGELADSGADTLFIILLALIAIYMVLAAQFESFSDPLTVMIAIPLGMVGAFGALWLLGLVDELGSMFYAMAHYMPDPAWWARLGDWIVPRIPAMNINLYSMIGVVLLLGLVTKNSILLVEFANQQRQRGADAVEAMITAGRVRLRPILMTAFSTIAGILPIAIGFGDGAESRRPMGVAIVGGMLTSTLLTLYVVPVIYTLLARHRQPLQGADEQ